MKSSITGFVGEMMGPLSMGLEYSPVDDALIFDAERRKPSGRFVQKHTLLLLLLYLRYFLFSNISLHLSKTLDLLWTVLFSLSPTASKLNIFLKSSSDCHFCELHLYSLISAISRISV